jgi:cation:H+ antiporter
MNISILMTFISGLTLLIMGAETLIRGASRFAMYFGISPLVIGLTIVAFGTSSPEFVVSLQAGLAGQADIALGNVVGSNIFNVLFILGVSAVIRPLFVSQQLIRLDVPIMIGVSLLVFMFGLDGKINRLDGFILSLGIVIYTIFLFHNSKRKNSLIKKESVIKDLKSNKACFINIIFIIVGLGMLIIGSRWLIQSAVVIAHALGIGSLVIGLTIVAAGTSLPELATSVMAVIRGEQDIAVGNIVGSNIFNILAVLGFSSFISPHGITISNIAMQFDILIMIAISIVCLPFFITGYKIVRWEGFYFIISYMLYIMFLIAYSTNQIVIRPVYAALFVFIIPVCLITLSTVIIRILRSSHNL